LDWKKVGFGLEEGSAEDPVSVGDELAERQALAAFGRLNHVGLAVDNQIHLYAYMHGQTLLVDLLRDPRFRRVIEPLQSALGYDAEGCADTLQEAYGCVNYYLAHFLPREARAGGTTITSFEPAEIPALSWGQLIRPVATALARFRTTAVKPAHELLSLSDELRLHQQERRRDMSAVEIKLLNEQTYGGMWGLAHLQTQLDAACTIDGEDRVLWSLMGVIYRCMMLAMPAPLQQATVELSRLASDR
jgi:hypothetical protein